MRMDEWIAAFGSDELSWADEEEEPFNGILSTSSSWCDGNILWVPATEKTEDDALDYSCSESSTEASQCSQQACNLHCVCVDCLKCPDHCTCNYSKNDYQCSATAGRKKNDTKQNEIRSESSRSQSSFWSAHFPSFSRSKKESPNKGFMVVPNNICVRHSTWKQLLLTRVVVLRMVHPSWIPLPRNVTPQRSWSRL